MKRLLNFFNSLNKEEREEFLKNAGISESLLRKNCSAGIPFREATCVSIEKAVGEYGYRRFIRPKDWRDIWPELAERVGDG